MESRQENATAQPVDTAAALNAGLDAQRAAYRRAEAKIWAQHAKIQRLTQSEAAAGQALAAAQAEIERLRQEQAHLQSRLSWRLTQPIRRVFERFPRAGRLAITLMRLAWWAATFQGARITARLRARARLRQQEAQIAADPMFDPAHYRQLDPAIAATGWSPARHYLLRGRFQRLTPHPLFDPDWYRSTYPDIGDQDPFTHYILQGRAADRWPNPFFDPAWYRQQHPEIATSGQDPLQHFVGTGAARRYDPSPAFQLGFYLDRYPDVAAGKLNPLAHYLAHGRREGRAISSTPVDAGPVDRARIEVRQRPRGGCW
jgi:hypothetical protein